MDRRSLLTAASLLPALALLPRPAWPKEEELYGGEHALYAAALQEGMCVSFNTNPEWANWRALFIAFKSRYPRIELSYNDLGSTATVTAMERSRRRPQADTAYYFAASGLDAMQKGLLEPFKPLNFERLTPSLRDAQGYWFGVHSLSIAFLVNRKLVKNVPTSWADLLRPEYKNSLVYMDPRSTGIGQVLCIAAAYAHGGSMDAPQAGIDYLGRLHAAGQIRGIYGVSQYAEFRKGQIPIWIGYENDGLHARYMDHMEEAEVVIPAEGSVAAPYGISLVKNGPNPHAGKLWLNFVMSDSGQSLFAQGFVRPAVSGLTLSAALSAKMPQAARITTLEVAKATQVKPLIDQLWTQATHPQ